MPKIPLSEYYKPVCEWVWENVPKSFERLLKLFSFFYKVLRQKAQKASLQIYHLIQASPGIARVKILVNCGYCLEIRSGSAARVACPGNP